MLQAMARKFGIDYSRPGNGICHYVHIERYAKPGRDPRGRRLAHHHERRARDDRDRRRRPRRGGRDGRLPVRDRLPGGRRGAARGRRSSGPWVQAKDIILELLRRPERERRQEQGLRVHRARHRGPVGARARHDREHDRRAGRHLRGLPARRQDARVAPAPAARGRLRGPRARRRRRVRRPRGDRPRRARPAGGEAVEPRQRRAGRGGGGHRARAGVHGLVGQLRLLRPGAARRRAGRPRRPDRAPVDRRPRPRRARARSSPRSPSRASTASSWRAACGCSSRSAGRAWAWARRRRRRQLAAHDEPQLPGPQRHARGLASTCARRRSPRCRCSRARSPTRASTATRPSCSSRPS